MIRVTERCGDLMEKLGRSIFGLGMRLKTSRVTAEAAASTIPVPMMNPIQLRDHLNSIEAIDAERA